MAEKIMLTSLVVFAVTVLVLNFMGRSWNPPDLVKFIICTGIIGGFFVTIVSGVVHFIW